MRIHAGTLGTVFREVGLLSERPRPGVCAGQIVLDALGGVLEGLDGVLEAMLDQDSAKMPPKSKIMPKTL